MSRLRKSKRLRVAILMLGIASAYGSLVGSAAAGSVNVTPDINNGYAWNANGWSGGLTATTRLWQMDLTQGTPGTFLWIRTPSVPAGVSIQSVKYTVDYTRTGGPQRFHLNLCQPGIFYANAGNLCGGPSLTSLPSGAGANPASGGIECFSSACNALQLSASGGYNDAKVNSFRLSYATLDDSVPPIQNTSYAGNPLVSSTWKRGTVSGTVAHADENGTGVRDSALLIDGVVKKSENFSCNYSQWTPCPWYTTMSATVDTTPMADGPHPAIYTVTDAASNTTTSAPVAFKTDNTAPDTPASTEVDSAGIGNWSPTNDFDISWQNGSEVNETISKSGISHVVVDVDPTDPAQSDPAAVEVPVGETASGISATVDSVSNVTVPAIGEWRVTVRLKDRAGNLSDLGAENDAASGRNITIGVDPTAPAKAEGHVNNGWVSRDNLITQVAKQRWELPIPMTGKAPVCGWGLSVTDNPTEDGIQTITVGSPTTEWPFPANLTEGVHFAHIRAINCAGTPSSVTEHKEVKVDLTDPTNSLTGVEAGRWYKDGQVVTMSGSDALSGMDGALPEDPNSTRGAYFTYSINGDGPTRELSPRGPQASLPVTGEGWKKLRFAAVDTAGNEASPMIVEFGIDASKPEGYIESQDAAKPTLLRTALTDGVSGLDHAITQVRNTAGGDWMDLPTSVSGFTGGEAGVAPKSAVASARFPDTKLEKGTYEVRTFAFDQAGNELVTARDRDGNKFTIENPMRKATGLSAAIFRGNHKKPVCAKKKTKGKKVKCVKKVRGRVMLVGGKTQTTVAYKHAGVIQGYLTTSDYKPLKGQPIEVYTKTEGGSEVLEGTTSTRANGYYYFRLKPGLSRKVRVAFAGTELLQDREEGLIFGQQARITLKVNKKRVSSGGAVTFSGKVQTRDGVYPSKGKIVVLQFYSAKKWRPAITITRTNARGNFKVTYRFKRTPSRVRAKIKFRVFAPSEVDFHHATSASPTRIVRVN